MTLGDGQRISHYTQQTPRRGGSSPLPQDAEQGGAGRDKVGGYQPRQP